MRRWGRYVPAPLITYLRGTIWHAAGDAATAAVFFEHSTQLEPTNENYLAILLATLKTANPAEAADRAESVLRNSATTGPAPVVYAADILLREVQGMSDLGAKSTCNRLIPIIEQTLTRMNDQEGVINRSLEVMALVLLAICYRHIGDNRQTVEYYSRAIQLDPTNDALLTFRGILTYGTDPNAPADFEQAIRLGSPLVWSYFCLAHHCLVNHRFEECRSLCERALQKTASTRVQSALYEFLAIALAGLDYPAHLIQQAFGNALRVDPFNTSARRNLETFELALTSRAPHPGNGMEPPEQSARAFSPKVSGWAYEELFERANSRVSPVSMTP